jgi:hypothetical protein
VPALPVLHVALQGSEPVVIEGGRGAMRIRAAPPSWLSTRSRVRADARWADRADVGLLGRHRGRGTLRIDRDDPMIGILLVVDVDDIVIEHMPGGTAAPLAVVRGAPPCPPGEVRRRLPAAGDLDRAGRRVVRAMAAPAEGALEPA